MGHSSAGGRAPGAAAGAGLTGTVPKNAPRLWGGAHRNYAVCAVHGKQKSGGKRYGTSEPCGRAGRKFIPRAWHRHWPFRRRFARCDCLFHHGPFGQQPQPRVYRKRRGIITQAADPSKLEDPSLIIYAPVRVFGNRTIVTNGDQTDTIFEAYEKGRGFAKALRTRTFEPDAPNFTPRISGVVKVSKKGK